MFTQRLVPLINHPGGGGGGGTPLTATCSGDTSVIKYTPTAGASFNTDPRTVIASGGDGGPYSASWDPGDSEISTNSPSSFTTSWHYHGHGIASFHEITNMVCTVRDGSGHVAYISFDIYMQSGGSPP